MSVLSKVVNDGHTLVIAVRGQFDSSMHKDFMDSYCTIEKSPDTCIVDMKNAASLGTHSLGMLLLLRDRVGEETIYKLKNCSNKMRKTLKNAKYGKLFDIE